MSGRWGARSSEHAGTRDFRRIGRDDSGFNGRQGVGRPVHAMPEAASGMSDNFVRGYDGASDGSRFEVRYIAVEDQPWHVVDDKGMVKKFNSQHDAEQYIREENRKALEQDRDERKELHYRENPPRKDYEDGRGPKIS